MSVFVILLSTLCVIMCMLGEATAITPLDTSLDTIPISYFGGVNCKQRSQENIQMLAKMRIIVIEKWEGPCWYECYANKTKNPPIPCQPSCEAENYQMNTIKQAKAVNPKLTAVFYLNTLYDFAMFELHEKFLNANADLMDINGKPIAFKNDNGMPKNNVFDFGKKVGRDLWIDFVKNLINTGVVDGLFADKPRELAQWNKTGSFWQICEHEAGKNPNWGLSCGKISNESAMDYNKGKPLVLDELHKLFLPDGCVFFNTTSKIFLRQDDVISTSPLTFAQNIQHTLSSHKYCYVQTVDLIGGDCTNTTSSCTVDQITFFLLGVEKGAVLGCNGWDEQFSKPLGDPLGPAAQKGNQVERHFKSGTYVTWDLSKKKGQIVWANSTSV